MTVRFNWEPELPAPAPVPAARTVLVCCWCGSVPAVRAQFEGQQEQPIALGGPFCRDCGIATFRMTTAWTLVHGWTMSLLSFALTPLTVLSNLQARRRVAKLAPPSFAASGKSPLPVGRPLLLRWESLGALVPLVAIAMVAAFIVHAVHVREAAQPKPRVGQCVSMSDADGSASVVDCARSHNGVITKVGQGNLYCPDDDTYLYWSDTGYGACAAGD